MTSFRACVGWFSKIRHCNAGHEQLFHLPLRRSKKNLEDCVCKKNLIDLSELEVLFLLPYYPMLIITCGVCLGKDRKFIRT